MAVLRVPVVFGAGGVATTPVHFVPPSGGIAVRGALGGWPWRVLVVAQLLYPIALANGYLHKLFARAMPLDEFTAFLAVRDPVHRPA